MFSFLKSVNFRYILLLRENRGTLLRYIDIADLIIGHYSSSSKPENVKKAAINLMKRFNKVITSRA